MSRRKVSLIKDQKQKLALLAAVFRWRINRDWCDALQINSDSTISAWKKEDNGISDRYKDVIVDLLTNKHMGINVDEFISLGYQEFGGRLGLNDDRINNILSADLINAEYYTDTTRLPPDRDGNNYKDLIDNYVGIYFSHERDDVLNNSLAIEKFTISRASADSGLVIKQHGNYVTRQSESGPLINRDGRIIGRLEYSDGSYPDSIFYLLEILTTESNKIFYGLYTDVTCKPVREIFSTKFILFSWNDERSLPERSYEGDELYELMYPLVQNDLSGRSRLVVEPPGHEVRASILSLVHRARAVLERMAL